jgi:hypothetical protein
MHMTDVSFQYLGEHGNFIAPVQKGALVSNEAADGDTAITLLFWDDGFSDVEKDGKLIMVQDRMSRFRRYDGLTEATIKRGEDGTLLLSGISDAARSHPAFGPDEDRVDVKVKPGPNCADCGHA